MHNRHTHTCLQLHSTGLHWSTGNTMYTSAHMHAHLQLHSTSLHWSTGNTHVHT